jgi:hypothetical protein
MSTLSNSVTAVVTSSIPSFVPTTAYQIRSLTGAFAPADANRRTLRLAIIHPTLGDPTQVNAGGLTPYYDQLAFSGGASQLTGFRATSWGGGHSGTTCNAMTDFDFSANGSVPNGFILRTVSTLTDQNGGASPYLDGQPTAIHTYCSGCELDGYRYRAGSFSFADQPQGPYWKRFNPSINSDIRTGWQQLANMPTSFDYSIPDPVSKKILFLNLWTQFFTYAIYRTPECATNPNTWSAVRSNNQSFQWPNDGCAGYRPDADPTTGTIVLTGGNFAPSVWPINWSTELMGNRISTGSLAQIGVGGMACFYDANRGVYWAFGGGASLTNLYEINPTTYAITAHALTPPSGEPSLGTIDAIGLYNRFVFIDSWRAIGVIPFRDGPAAIIKLP